MSGIPSIADWASVVANRRSCPGLTDTTRAFLLHLALHHMREGRNGVPRVVWVSRAQLAAELGMSERKVSDRYKAAVEAGALDRLVRGHKGVIATYQGTFPSRGKQALSLPTDIPTGLVKGAVDRHPEPVTKGAVDRHPIQGHSGTPGVPTTSNHVGTEPDSSTSPRGQEKTRSNEKAGDQPSRPSGSTHEASSVPDEDPSSKSKNFAGGKLASRVEQGVDAVDRETRRAILDEIQRCASNGDSGRITSEELDSLLEEHYGQEISDWASCYWTFPKAAATDRYVAGQQLNKLINTGTQEVA